MHTHHQPIVVLAGNPNCGKSTIFNRLTGLRQHTGNFPGVTVDIKTGLMSFANKRTANVIDLPGCYSLFPNSHDERIVLNLLSNPNDSLKPDVVLYIADALNLEKHLLLLTQLMDLELPVVLVINRIDLAFEEGLTVDDVALSKELGIPVVCVSGRFGDHFDRLLTILSAQLDGGGVSCKRVGTHSFSDFYKPTEAETNTAQRIADAYDISVYRATLWAHHYQKLPFLRTEQREVIENICTEEGYDDLRLQIHEVMQRYDHFTPIVRKVVKKQRERQTTTDKIDALVTHPLLGVFLFFGLMFLVFQAVYSWSSVPMDWIDGAFGTLNSYIKGVLPPSLFTDLLTDGIVSGLGGVMVFVPQIALLFLLLTLLEEIGYMSRAVYMFDHILQRFGLNGRSIVSLVSSGACAIPAIMSARTIANRKERLTTILVAPLVSCSARIPVFTVLIGLMIPNTRIFGIFNSQGIAFMGLYLLSIAATLLSALFFRALLRTDETSYLSLEMPDYRIPHWRNVAITIYEKVKTFILEAGKIIVLISVILWGLASFGPPRQMAQAEQKAQEIAQTQQLTPEAAADLVAANKLESSYAGHIGKWIEPIIRPLGFDWKIGIALITSFAAREVFVGTMATLYSVGHTDDEVTIREQMRNARNTETGAPVYTFASSFSLLLFYLFAMQCMSTLAVVRRETGSWKWPIIQFLYMGFLAYCSSFIAYQLLS